MSGRILWKLLLVGFVAAWAAANLFPLKDTPFDAFVSERATQNQDDYKALLEKAQAEIEAGKYPSLYQAIPALATAEKLDLNATFFPDVKLVYISNLKERNRTMMRVLLRHSQGRLKLGLDLSGGIAFTLKVGDAALVDKNASQREYQLEQVMKIMRDRVNAFGVSEPVIRPVGDDSVEIQLAGINAKDNPEAIDNLKKPARLEFRSVHRTMRPDTTPVAEWPIGYEAMTYEVTDMRTGEVSEVRYFVRQLPLATGTIIERSYPQLAPGASDVYWVGMSFTSEGRDVFANMTRQMVQQNRETGTVGSMAVVLDGRLESVASVQNEIRGDAVIQGTFTYKEAVDLSSVLNNPLEVPLEISEMYEVGPTLAEDARLSSIEAALLGAGLVILFMLVFYRVAGVVSVFTVAVNVFIVIGVLASLGATLTLPGVAALVLTIGMAVDANILIFERIREEIRDGKRLETAVQGGFSKAFSTIVDANVTTLITASILILLGTGPVKGFGVTLAIGIGATVFCALILTRGLLEGLLAMNLQKLFSAAKQERAIDFQSYRKPAFVASWIIVLLGIVTLVQVGNRAYGIDFLGGEELVITYEKPVELGAITQLAVDREFGEVVPNYQNMIGESSMSVLKIQTEEGKGNAFFELLSSVYPDAGLELAGANIIGASVSSSITWNAILSVVVALGCILLYIAVRFEFGYGIGAIVATVHDVLMTISLFIVFGQFLGLGSGQFTAPMVAAILMIVGYSINDTIVVFDRIREELELNPGVSLLKIINLAINRTLSRTILTSLTTLLAAVSLFIFGAGVVTDYALVFILGILTGTFSSIFIASPVFYWWHKGDRRHVEEREFLPKYDWETGAK